MIPEDFGRVGLLVLLGLAFPALPLVVSQVLFRVQRRPENPDPVKNATYECGVESEGTAWGQFNARYYIFALLFVMFDVEAVFIFPWATRLEVYDGFGLVEMGIFIVILALGLVYAWRKKVLRWV